MSEEIKCPYSAKVLARHDYGGACWNGQRIGVFDGESQIGEYLRNYHGFGEQTFAPFLSGGNWYALYSKDYTCTRLMKLPSCEDIGGEESDGFGFCPTALYVPQVCTQDITTPEPYNPRRDIKKWATVREEDGRRHYDWPDGDQEYKRLCDEHDAAFEQWMDANPFTWKYAPFGFVSGCIWGDDCSWKIEYIDLSRVADGVITREARFGYIELPGGVDLKTAIDLSSYEHGTEFVTIAVQKRFALSGAEQPA